MSTKKDKFSQKDHYYMTLALNLARERNGLTGVNPSVGCVIVKNDQVISLGQTGINGRPHAEYNAIKSSKKSLKNSTMYVSLEPCTHFGKTPPCTNIIIKNKIKEVVFPIIDADKRTCGKSFRILNKKKIKVRHGLLSNIAKSIYKSYSHNKIKNLPFVTGKLVISKDLYIVNKNKKRISNKYSDSFSQFLRYKNDSILVSSKTINKDNSKLNCRLEGLEKYSPKRIILDRNLSIKKNLYLYKSSNLRNTIIFYNKTVKKKINFLKGKGIKLIKLNTSNDNLFDLRVILNKIYSLGCRNLLVEGGKFLTKNFIKEKLFNQFFLIRSPKNLNKNAKLNVSSELQLLSFNYKNKVKLNSFTGNDIVNLHSN